MIYCMKTKLFNVQLINSFMESYQTNMLKMGQNMKKVLF